VCFEGAPARRRPHRHAVPRRDRRAAAAAASSPRPTAISIDAFEKAYLIELLREHRGNLARAARAAGMDRKNLWTLVARHGLDRDQFRKP